MTTFNGVEMTDQETVSATIGKSYIVETRVSNNATAGNIEIYKMSDNKPDVFLCENSRHCSVSITFDDVDVAATNVTIGSRVDYGYFMEDVTADVDVSVNLWHCKHLIHVDGIIIYLLSIYRLQGESVVS